MNPDQGWTQNPAELLVYRVVHLMGSDVHDATKIGHMLEVGGAEVGEAFDTLIERGYATALPRRLSDFYTHDALLTSRGKSQRSRWAAAQTGGRRKRACLAALLAWFDAHDGDPIDSTDQFVGDVRAYYFGIPFDPTVLNASARELMESGLIKGSGTWGGPVLRPSITTSGTLVVSRYGGDLVEWQEATSSTGNPITIHNSTGVAVATNSPGASQSVSVRADASEQVLNLAAALQEMLPILRLEPAQEASAHGLIVQLQEAAPHVESDPGKVKQLVSGVRNLAINATGGAAGSALFALAEQVASNL